jgi:Mg/Co/Ni transporter MgtE
VVYFYVVDLTGRLVGVVPTRKLLLSAPEVTVEDIMIRRLVKLPATATVRDACELFTLYRFLALPVVASNGRLLGVIDIELYTDELDQLGDAEKLVTAGTRRDHLHRSHRGPGDHPVISERFFARADSAYGRRRASPLTWRKRDGGLPRGGSLG